MTITINIKPEVEAELARQAEGRGLDVPAYVAALLEQATQPTRPEVTDRQFRRVREVADRIAQFSDQIPALPDNAFSRESLYRDHD